MCHFFDAAISVIISLFSVIPYFTPLRHFDLPLSNPSVLEQSSNHGPLLLFQETLTPVSPLSSPCKQSDMSLYPAISYHLSATYYSCLIVFPLGTYFFSPLLKKKIYLTNFLAQRACKRFII